MAFSRTGLQPVGAQSAAPNSPAVWSYRTADLASEVDDSGYFNLVNGMLRTGDIMIAECGSGTAQQQTLEFRVVVTSGVVALATSNKMHSRLLALPVTAVANTDFTVDLPRCHITAIHQRTTTAYGVQTNMNLTIGNAAGGNQIVAAVDVKAKGNRQLTLVDAGSDLIAPWAGGTLHVRMAQVGTASADGAGFLNFNFVPA